MDLKLQHDTDTSLTLFDYSYISLSTDEVALELFKSNPLPLGGGYCVERYPHKPGRTRQRRVRGTSLHGIKFD